MSFVFVSTTTGLPIDALTRTALTQPDGTASVDVTWTASDSLLAIAQPQLATQVADTLGIAFR